MSASKSVVVVDLQQLSLEECNSNGSRRSMSLHYFNECSPAINDTSCWHVGIKISHRCRLAAVKFGGVQLERLPTTMSLHYFNECCSPAINDTSCWHVGIKISLRCRLAAVIVWRSATRTAPDDDVVALFQWMLHQQMIGFVGMSASKSVVVVVLQQLSLEECNSNGSPMTKSPEEAESEQCRPQGFLVPTSISQKAIVCLISDEVENKPLEDASKRRIARSNVWLIITIIIMARFLFNKALRL